MQLLLDQASDKKLCVNLGKGIVDKIVLEVDNNDIN
jgi:hypothetical protein